MKNSADMNEGARAMKVRIARPLGVGIWKPPLATSMATSGNEVRNAATAMPKKNGIWPAPPPLPRSRRATV